MKYILYIIILFLLSFLEAVYAQSNAPRVDSVTTEEIVVTANRIKVTPLNSPNKIQVLDRNYIISLNGNKLSDILSFSNGVFIKDYGFNSGIKTVSINSTQTEHALILYNGVKLNSRQNAQFDAGLLPVDEIWRVEISKGGASSLYGSEAIGGMVNIVTGSGIQGKPFGFEITGEYGSYNYRKLFLRGLNSFNTRRKSFVNIRYSYSNEEAVNNYEYDFFNGLNNVIKKRENSDYKKNTFNFNMDYNINNSARLSLFTLYNHRNAGAPGPDAGYSSSLARQIDRDLISSVNLQKSFDGENELSASVSHKYSLMNYYDPQTAWLAAPLNSYYKLNSYISTSEFKHTFSKQSEIDFGFDVSYNDIKSNEIETGKSFQGALFAAGKYKFANQIISNITLYPSIRYDYYSNINKNVPTGKLGLNVKPFDGSDLSFKSSFGNNFAAPTFNELYWKELGNNNLLPERSICLDAGLYYALKLISDNLFEFSYFNISTTDRIVWTPDAGGVWRPINVGKVKSEGVDMSLRSNFKLTDFLAAEFRFNYNYGSSLKKNMDFPGDLTYNKQLISWPMEYAKSSLSFSYLPSIKLMKIISLNVFYTFAGKRFIDQENTKFVPYYEIIDANIGAVLNILNTETNVKFIVNNLTNRNYQVVSGYPMPLRNCKLQIGIKY